MKFKILISVGAGICAAILATSAGRIAPSSSPSPRPRMAATETELVADAPPMGWNSWDGYGTTITEADFKKNAQWLSKNLLPYYWKYVTVDMEWFVTNPTAEGNGKNFIYSMDSNGRYTPAPNRFPSAGNESSFKPLADFVHGLGLKFGIHILRGIPKSAVEKNLPIAGSPYHGADAADRSDTCPWNFDNFGIDATKPAGQAYYDSVAKLYAQWGVDLIKVDCIASHPYKGDEIRMLGEALRKTGRPIVLSLSPGPAPYEKTEEMSQYANMWRISDDIWDLWHSTVQYPQGLGDQFANVAKWAGVGRPGHWPDADMLPLGFLGPAPGWGQVRRTRLTHDEQRTLMSLWCIFPSPLMIGGDLTAADDWTVSLLTNREVLDMDQFTVGNRVALSTDQIVVWVADSSVIPGAKYVGVFNRSESSQTVRFDWKDLKLEPGKYFMRDMWADKDLAEDTALNVTVPSHGVALYTVANSSSSLSAARHQQASHN